MTFEYALMNGHQRHARSGAPAGCTAQGRIVSRQPDPAQPGGRIAIQPSTPEDAAAFQAILDGSGVPTTMRLRRGIDIDAGCGQLRRRTPRLRAEPDTTGACLKQYE